MGYAPERGDSLIINGNSTDTPLENIIATCKDLTIYINELAQMKDKTKQTLGYLIANASGGLRANSDRTSKERTILASNVVMAGEASGIPTTQTDGIAVRLSTITSRPIPEFKDAKDQAALENMLTAILSNYGHILPLFLEQFFKHKKELRDIYDVALSRLRSSVTAIEIRRKAPTFAAIEVTGWLLEKVYEQLGIDVVNPSDIIDQFWQECAIDNVQRPMGINALAAVYDFIIANSNEHFLENDVREEVRKTSLFGWFGKAREGFEYIDILKANVDDYLTKKGFTALGSVYTYWKQNDIIHTSKPNDNSSTGYHYKDMAPNTQKTSFPVVRFKKDVVRKMLDMPHLAEVILANISQKDIEKPKLTKEQEDELYKGWDNTAIDDSKYPQNPYDSIDNEW